RKSLAAPPPDPEFRPGPSPAPIGRTGCGRVCPLPARPREIEYWRGLRPPLFPGRAGASRLGYPWPRLRLAGPLAWRWGWQPDRDHSRPGHAGLQLQPLNDHRRAIGFREGTVQLHQPAQPYRTGDRMAAGTDAPYDSDDADDADQGEKDVGDDHGSQTQARSTAKR